MVFGLFIDDFANDDVDRVQDAIVAFALTNQVRGSSSDPDPDSLNRTR